VEVFKLNIERSPEINTSTRDRNNNTLSFVYRKRATKNSYHVAFLNDSSGHPLMTPVKTPDEDVTVR
jgi:hypothetical protein